MDRLLEKLPRLITSGCEQALVAIVLACFVIAFALLTIPDSISSFTSLCELAWDQLSAPSPHAPAGDLTFRLIKIWTNHVVDLEFPKLIRAGASEDAAVIAAAHPRTRQLQRQVFFQLLASGHGNRGL